MISGSSDQAAVDAAMSAGANAFLVKPVTSKLLAEQLERFGLPAQKRAALGSDAPQAALPKTEPLTTPAADIPPADCEDPIRVMIVDDSAVVRRIIASVLKETPGFQVASAAANGQVALDELATARPEIVLLDIEMPVMNGFETLKQLRERRPRLPVIMFSSLTERGASATLEALFLGASDYVPKPGGSDLGDIEAGKKAIRDELLPKLRQWARPAKKPRADSVSAVASPPVRPAVNRRIDVVAIGVSTGGPQALARVLPDFARNCPTPIVIVQHMPPMFTRYLADRLSTTFQLPVHEGQEGCEVQAGHAYIAPGGYHMQLTRVDARVRIRLNQGPAENACRPSADVLFHSVADVYGAASLTVVLTGMGRDGLLGCQRLHQLGGQIIVQDEPSSVVWGMPGHVARAGLAMAVLPLDQVGAEITNRLAQKRGRLTD